MEFQTVDLTTLVVKIVTKLKTVEVDSGLTVFFRSISLSWRRVEDEILTYVVAVTVTGAVIGPIKQLQAELSRLLNGEQAVRYFGTICTALLTIVAVCVVMTGSP